ACSEDIGLANPQAMVQAVSAMEAYHRIGWPEAKYNAAQAILFAVESPKSNAAAVAISRVMEAIDEIKSAEVPPHLRDAHYRGAAELGRTGTKKPHDSPGHYVSQRYLRDKLQGRTFDEASDMGMEEKIRLNQEGRKQM